MAIRKLFLLGLLLLTGILNAQTDFRPGYVIPVHGDTLFGQIDYRGDLLMGLICKFKDNESKITEYYPDDIVAFRFIDSKYFVSKEINNKKAFLELLIKGKLNIYYLRDDDGNHYYFEKEDVELTEIPYKEEVKYVNHKPYLSKSSNHVGVLTYYLQDAPSLKSKIEAIKRPEHQNLLRLAEDYHYALCDNEECIIYKKPVPFTKLSFKPFAGITKYNGYDITGSEFGAYVYFWMPRLNENIYFKTGFAYHSVPGGSESFAVRKIPFQFQYIYKAYKVQPHLSVGNSVFAISEDDKKIIRYYLSLNAGVNCQLTKSISLSADFNSDHKRISEVLFDPNQDSKMISYSMLVGLRIDL